jgi:hypothetical protein
MHSGVWRVVRGGSGAKAPLLAARPMRQHGSVCARQVRGSILRNFCRLVAHTCRVVSLRQLSARDRTALGGALVVFPRPGSCRVLGGLKAAFERSHSPGPWRARRLDIVDVNSRVWLTATRTYIACAVAFMV